VKQKGPAPPKKEEEKEEEPQEKKIMRKPRPPAKTANLEKTTGIAQTRNSDMALNHQNDLRNIKLSERIDNSRVAPNDLIE